MKIDATSIEPRPRCSTKTNQDQERWPQFRRFWWTIPYIPTSIEPRPRCSTKTNQDQERRSKFGRFRIATPFREAEAFNSFDWFSGPPGFKEWERIVREKEWDYWLYIYGIRRLLLLYKIDSTRTTATSSFLTSNPIPIGKHVRRRSTWERAILLIQEKIRKTHMTAFNLRKSDSIDSKERFRWFWRWSVSD